MTIEYTKKTIMLVILLGFLSAGITFALNYIELPEKTSAFVANNVAQNSGEISNLDLIVAESVIKNEFDPRDLTRLIVADNVTRNPETDQLSLLIILLDLFPHNTEDLSRLIATERTL